MEALTEPNPFCKEMIDFLFDGFRRKGFGQIAVRFQGDYLFDALPVHPAGQEDYRDV